MWVGVAVGVDGRGVVAAVCVEVEEGLELEFERVGGLADVGDDVLG